VSCRRLALALLALGLLPAGCARPRDNVVVVVVDTLRQDHLATYGYARDPAPFLGELARQGATFDGLSPSSWTKPGAASLLTGLHPVRHQTFDRWDHLPAGAVTLAERLQHAGYHTLAASANGWVSPVFGFDQGFEGFVLQKNATGTALNRALFPTLDHLQPPFFLYVHYLDPHAPYDPATGWDGRPLPAALRAQGRVGVRDLDAEHAYPRSPELLARVRDLYDGEIRASDDALRELVGHLRSRGMMDSTILVVTADHGEEMNEHGRMSHGQTLYQEVLRIPLVFHAPHRFKAGQRFGRASLLDVAPTLMDLLGVKPEDGNAGFDGLSLAAFLTGRRRWPAVDRRPFLEQLDFTDGANLALLEGERKIVLGKDQKELYDLAADPREQHNLIGAAGGVADFARLGGELAAQYNADSRRALDRSSADVDINLEEKLADLGYVAPEQSVRQRVIPQRLDLPASDWVRWEPFGTLSSCARVADADSERYLLQGWYKPEQGGRWTERQASLLVQPATDEPSRLVVSGVNFRPSPVHLSLQVESRPLLDLTVATGPFKLSPGVAAALLRQPTRVEISTGTTFVPSTKGGADDRALGIFLNSVCLEPGSEKAASAQPAKAPASRHAHAAPKGVAP
jgi:arylsulfatase A-like enzyme